MQAGGVAHQRDPRPHRRATPGPELGTEDPSTTGRGPQQRGEDVEQGALAGAVRAGHADGLPGGDREVLAAQDGDPLHVHRDARQRHQRAVGGPLSWRHRAR